jgi:saccharopine dehydrogenase-like NADP-dependent oxidoreductase
MADATAVPLALTAKLFAEGRLPPPGVHSPEAVIDPQEFFDRFHSYCSYPNPVARQDLIEIAMERDRAVR